MSSLNSPQTDAPDSAPVRRIWLVYDTECPACDYYCNLVRIRESVGELMLVDARENGPLMQEITARGLDIDQGMVLMVDEQMYYGADAIHALSLLGSDNGLFNRLNYLVFRSPKLARVLYPVLRSCRNLLLKLLRKTRINNLDQPGNDRF
ncbi:DCC1-like thiol-disulfide oxidoreductase family protein [Isoalcanivorax indicus]|uniref:DCC1-like thiol-disulfide oxidoreductase family protein n=1 Tax=Isoalcanivorax indicus TaxID=2202653 RepID=UPI001FE269A6|nr:DCC1-like thiol-disulfide oxidoreductase family protein [Isoalcanivorax indicus]